MNIKQVCDHTKQLGEPPPGEPKKPSTQPHQGPQGPEVMTCPLPRGPRRPGPCRETQDPVPALQGYRGEGDQRDPGPRPGQGPHVDWHKVLRQGSRKALRSYRGTPRKDPKCWKIKPKTRDSIVECKGPWKTRIKFIQSWAKRRTVGIEEINPGKKNWYNRSCLEIQIKHLESM